MYPSFVISIWCRPDERFNRQVLTDIDRDTSDVLRECTNENRSDIIQKLLAVDKENLSDCRNDLYQWCITRLANDECSTGPIPDGFSLKEEML